MTFQTGFWDGQLRERFVDRVDAGQRLGQRLAPLLEDEPVVVLGLPRGGVPVAREVAREVGGDLDVLVVRKIGVPWQPELALGAVSSGNVVVLNDDVVRATGVAGPELEEAVRQAREELGDRERAYRGERTLVDVAGRTAVVVDDGIATGATIRAALKALVARGATRTVVAAPVAPPETVASLRREADDVVCLATPADLVAIGLWYENFDPVSDEEVVAALQDASRR